MKRFFLLILGVIPFLALELQAQSTPQSCDCEVDTVGLRATINSLTLNENIPLKFEVSGSSPTYAVMHGFINSNTPSVVQTFINDYPTITTLVFMQIPGSDDDDTNLQASQLLRNRGYTTYLPAVNVYNQDAFIASGGVDMFLAGTRRVIDVNAEVGVHSWSDGTNQATDFPVGDPVHQPYIDYYVAMGFSQADAEAFYYFTINAAPASGIHNMTESELEQYKLRTCTYAANPTYTTTQSGDVIKADLAGAGYQWLDCDNGNAPISGATGQSYLATNSGNYAVEVTENNCMGVSACQMITVTGLSEQTIETIAVYPNPAVDEVMLDLEQGVKGVYQLFDLAGRQVRSGLITGSLQRLELVDLQPGMYLLNLETSQGVFQEQLVIRR